MAILEGSIYNLDYDSVVDDISDVMVSLDFTVDSDTGTALSRAIIFSLTGHYHKIKLHWVSDTGYYLYFTVLNTDNSTALIPAATTNASVGSIYQYFTLYRAIKYNNLRALWLYTYPTTWRSVFIYTTAGTKKVICAKYLKNTLMRTVVEDSNLIGLGSYAIETALLTDDLKSIFSPVLLQSDDAKHVCDALVDGITFCGSHGGVCGQKMQLDGKYHIVSNHTSSGDRWLIRYA